MEASRHVQKFTLFEMELWENCTGAIVKKKREVLFLSGASKVHKNKKQLKIMTEKWTFFLICS
jgi:hypothetical protein